VVVVVLVLLYGKLVLAVEQVDLEQELDFQ
jgi:hypothetical protein